MICYFNFLAVEHDMLFRSLLGCVQLKGGIAVEHDLSKKQLTSPDRIEECKMAARSRFVGMCGVGCVCRCRRRCTFICQAVCGQWEGRR